MERALSGSCAAELRRGEACKTECTCTQKGKGGRFRNRRGGRYDGSCGECRGSRSQGTEGVVSEGVEKAGCRKSGDAGEIQRGSNGRLVESIKSYGQRADEKESAGRCVRVVGDIDCTAAKAHVIGQQGRESSGLGPSSCEERWWVELKCCTHILDSSCNDELAGHKGVGVESDWSQNERSCQGE